jgi:hypothetical protein
VLLVVLAGCGESPQPGQTLTAVRHDVCKALPVEVVREHLDDAVTETDPSVLSERTDICTYQTEDAPALGFSLTTALTTLPRRGNRSVTEYLDDVFSERAGEKPGPYDKVDGLGQAAGFGRYASIRQLVVITSDDEHVYEVILEFSDLGVTVDQARPMAERLIEGLGG